jgi:hypothetical protein
MPLLLSESSPIRRQQPQEPPPAASRVELTWTIPVIDGDAPSARGGHSAVLAGEMLYIFGGHYFGSQGAFVYLNDLHRLDLRTSAWAEIVFPKKKKKWGKIQGITAEDGEDDQPIVPSPRYNHSAVLLNGGGRMFVFGGRGDGQGANVSKNGEGAALRDMFFLDLDALAWFQVQWTTDSPRGRFGHGCVEVDDARMAVFGGWDGATSMNDLWIFDSHTFTWQQPKCRGKPPTARHSMSMVRAGGSTTSTTLMVYGGYSVLSGQLPVYNKDIFLLDVDSLTWSRPRLVGEYPSATFGHGACLVDAEVAGKTDGGEEEQFALIFGGWSGTERSPLYMGDKNVRDLVKMEAREQRLTGGETAAHDGSVERRRWTEDRTRELQQSSSNARVLDVTRMEWFRPRARGIEIGNRYGHSATRVGPHVFLFGGWDGNRALNQLVVGQVSIS